MDNVGDLGPGDVQWMKAGSGVIHSEMPKQEDGRMRGFQLWVNLAAAEKMTPAEYRDLNAADIPRYQQDGLSIKSIAGNLKVNGIEVEGAVTGRTTEPGYLNLHAEKSKNISVQIPDGHNLLVYVYEGSALVAGSDMQLDAGKLARFSHQGELQLDVEAGTRLLIISGKPLGEPIVHYGPFVMNSMQEIQQAVQDYSSGSLV